MCGCSSWLMFSKKDSVRGGLGIVGNLSKTFLVSLRKMLEGEFAQLSKRLGLSSRSNLDSPCLGCGVNCATWKRRSILRKRRVRRWVGGNHHRIRLTLKHTIRPLPKHGKRRFPTEECPEVCINFIPTRKQMHGHGR